MNIILKQRIYNLTIDKTCCICMDDIKIEKVHVLEDCGHMFHDECIDKWTNKVEKTECPTCKTIISKKLIDNWTPLILKESSQELLSKLIDITPDINVKIGGSTLLIYALVYSTPDIVTKILDMKPDIHRSNVPKLLFYALCYLEDRYIIKFINMRPDMNIQNICNWTPLMLALKYSTPEITKKILDMKPDINTKNNDNWTALMFALKYSTSEIVNKILGMNPELNIKNNWDWTPLMLALKYSTSDIISKILHQTPKVFDDTHIKNSLLQLLNTGYHESEGYDSYSDDE